MQNLWDSRRGNPWEFDNDPPKNRKWARIFSEMPNYRLIGKNALGREKFRWHFGAMNFRGRLEDNAVKVLIIGQEGAQDESLSHRSFTGGTGARMQNFLDYLGITHSYLFLNTFLYPIFGQYNGSALINLAQDLSSPIVRHRHEIFNYVLERNDVHLIVGVGRAAQDSIVTWVTSRGGSCPVGSNDVSQCTGQFLDPKTKIVGVRHPGGAGNGGSITAIKNSFIQAIQKIEAWIAADPDWLPLDPEGTRDFAAPYKYRSLPIPFKDFPFGTNWRLGRGATSSNRKDSQRSIQIFSANGKYNNKGASLKYSDLAHGTKDGYDDQYGTIPYEPPNIKYKEYDQGPRSKSVARLIMGGKPGFEWPDFEALGVKSDPSFGYGPIYRGRFNYLKLLVLADQQCHDDLFTCRALSGNSGQHMQSFFNAIGIEKDYLILRVLPVDTLNLTVTQKNNIVDHPQIRKIYQKFIDTVMQKNAGLNLILTFGAHSKRLADNLNTTGLHVFNLKAWKSSGSEGNWKASISQIRNIPYQREMDSPSYVYNGERIMIPRFDLPYGTLCWQGSSGDRARQALIRSNSVPSPDYFKLFIPDWVYRLRPDPDPD